MTYQPPPTPTELLVTAILAIANPGTSASDRATRCRALAAQPDAFWRALAVDSGWRHLARQLAFESGGDGLAGDGPWSDVGPWADVPGGSSALPAGSAPPPLARVPRVLAIPFADLTLLMNSELAGTPEIVTVRRPTTTDLIGRAADAAVASTVPFTSDAAFGTGLARATAVPAFAAAAIAERLGVTSPAFPAFLAASHETDRDWIHPMVARAVMAAVETAGDVAWLAAAFHAAHDLAHHHLGHAVALGTEGLDEFLLHLHLALGDLALRHEITGPTLLRLGVVGAITIVLRHGGRLGLARWGGAQGVAGSMDEAALAAAGALCAREAQGGGSLQERVFAAVVRQPTPDMLATLTVTQHHALGRLRRLPSTLPEGVPATRWSVFRDLQVADSGP